MCLAEWELAFDHPWALVALVAAAVPVALAGRARRRRGRVRPLSALMQTLAVAAVVAALAGPRAGVTTTALRPWLVLTDVSASTRGQHGARLDWDASVPREAYAFAAEVFAGDARVPKSATWQTRIAPALQLAAARARKRQLGGVVIRTDGQFDAADPWPAAAAALAGAADDVPVFIVPLESPPPDARISHIAADADAAGNVTLTTSVASNALQEPTLRLFLADGLTGRTLLRKKLRLMPKEHTTLRVEDKPVAQDLLTYYARLQPADAFPENDVATALLMPRQQYVGLVGNANTVFGAQLGKLPGISAVDAGAPEEADLWMQYACVVVVDTEGTSFNKAQRTALAEYVRGGGGLVLVGSGPRKTPDDHRDPLNQVLALIANPHERKAMKVSVVLDASGSMAAATDGPGDRRQSKFDQAAQAVMGLKRHLTPADALAVITFSDKPTRIYDSGSRPPDFTRLRDALLAVKPSGPTHVAAALQMATAAAADENQPALVMLVSDLITQPFDVAAMARRVEKSNHRLAVVAVTSPGSDERYPLEDLAAALKARLVRRDHLKSLADVFAEFLTGARGDAVRRGRFAPVPVGEPFGLKADGLGPLTSYILSAEQPRAEALVRIGTDPVVARRRVGLGRSVTVAIPAGADDNPKWWQSRFAGRLVTESVRWSLRPAADSRFTGSLSRDAGRLRLQVDARDDKGPMNLLELVAVTARPGAADDPHQTPLRQVAPGRYEAPLPALPQGTVQVRDGGGAVRWHMVFGRQCPPEVAAIGADWAKLRQLAERTGARIVSAAELPAEARRARRERYQPLWPWLLALGLGGMLVDWVIVRR